MLTFILNVKFMYLINSRTSILEHDPCWSGYQTDLLSPQYRTRTMSHNRDSYDESNQVQDPTLVKLHSNRLALIQSIYSWSVFIKTNTCDWEAGLFRLSEGSEKIQTIGFTDTMLELRSTPTITRQHRWIILISDSLDHIHWLVWTCTQ